MEHNILEDNRKFITWANKLGKADKSHGNIGE
jgi:hypothetical protein